MAVDAGKFNDLSVKIGYARKLREEMLAEGRAWCENASDPRSKDGMQGHRLMAATERMMTRGNPSPIRQLLNSDLLRLVQLANLALCSLILERDEQQLRFLVRDEELLRELDSKVLAGDAGVFNAEHAGDVARGVTSTEDNTHAGE